VTLGGDDVGLTAKKTAKKTAKRTAKDDYDDHLRSRHRRAHARRTADRWAAHLLPHLRPDMRVLDIGCGPGSITVGLGTETIGVDLDPMAIDGVPVSAADAASLPFPDASFDAVWSNATLQHVPSPLAVLQEARRVARPGAVIGLGDADWGGYIFHPHDPLIERGWAIREAFRAGSDVRVGSKLRDLLTQAGFERAELFVTGNVAGTAEATMNMGFGEWTWFEEPTAVSCAVELGLSDADEMQAIAEAWKRWAGDPGASGATFWFTALAWAPS
jgi:SAM-dependent methyltransferase